jgi:DNA-binding NarL/FixJ family response regulator
LLRDRDDIAVIGEAWGLPETIQKTAELLPDVVIVDLRMTASAIDEIAREQAERLGTVKFNDKTDSANELIPTLLQFAPANKPS